jgi:hypothetical protein
VATEISEPVKGAIIAEYLTGETKSNICRNLKVSRPTIIKVLNEAEIDEYVRKTKSILMSGSPLAAQRIVKEAAKDHNVAFELLDRQGILIKQRENGAATQVNVALGFEGMAAPYVKEEKPEP